MSDYNKDLAICEKATEGPWGFAEQTGLILAGGTLIGDARFLSDGEFIATFNPSHMIERIKREQAKDERIVELEAFVRTVFESSLMGSDDVIKTTFHEYIQCAEELLK